MRVTRRCLSTYFDLGRLAGGGAKRIGAAPSGHDRDVRRGLRRRSKSAAAAQLALMYKYGGEFADGVDAALEFAA